MGVGLVGVGGVGLGRVGTFTSMKTRLFLLSCDRFPVGFQRLWLSYLFLVSGVKNAH